MSLAPPEKEIGRPTATDRETDGPAYRPAVIKNGQREGEREAFPLCVVSLDLQLGLLLRGSASMKSRRRVQAAPTCRTSTQGQGGVNKMYKRYINIVHKGWGKIFLDVTQGNPLSRLKTTTSLLVRSFVVYAWE